MGNAPKKNAPRTTVANALLMVIGLVLAGCAVAPVKDKAEPVSVPVKSGAAALPAPAQPAGPSVARFSDGREGFVITEAATMDGQSRAAFDQAIALIKDAQFDQAIQRLEKVVAQPSAVTAPYINLAIAYGKVNKPELAEQQLKKALELVPGHPVASNEYGLLLRKAGRFAESRQVFERSIALFPEYVPTHKNLGILCDLYLKDYACAIEQYESYGRAMPRDEKVKLWIADLETRSGRNLTASAKP